MLCISMLAGAETHVGVNAKQSVSSQVREAKRAFEANSGVAAHRQRVHRQGSEIAEGFGERPVRVLRGIEDAKFSQRVVETVLSRPPEEDRVHCNAMETAERGRPRDDDWFALGKVVGRWTERADLTRRHARRTNGRWQPHAPDLRTEARRAVCGRRAANSE